MEAVNLIERHDDRVKLVGTRLLEIIGPKVSAVAKYDANILLLGETGVGKGLVAKFIHQVSDRYSKDFEVVHCPALPENLLETGLFGHVRGSFTGSVANEEGILVKARGGTVFLDEISEIPINLQAKILRAVEDMMIRPVGSNKEVSIDVRFIAASNRNLEELISQGKFRKDLYYRLSDFKIEIPPLRERVEDIHELASHFIEYFSSRYNKHLDRNLEELMLLLQGNPWEGNVRELMGVIKAETILPGSSGIDISKENLSCKKVLPNSIVDNGNRLLPLEKAIENFESEYIRDALWANKGSVLKTMKIPNKVQ